MHRQSTNLVPARVLSIQQRRMMLPTCIVGGDNFLSSYMFVRLLIFIFLAVGLCS